MEIKSNHIKEAEAILINGNTFDEKDGEKERVPFIKNLETRDLLAVPGSGKTTALQAKLYCLAKQMPFEDRSGILVLSHTNKAVEEIEKKLKNHCPQLFEYPNFVGTIQSFVDVFLAFPYYTNYKKEKIHSVSDEFYLSAVSTYIKKFRNGSEAYIKNKNPNLFHSARYWFDDNNEKILAAGLTNKPLSFCPPNTWVNDGTDTEKISAVIGSIKEMKKKLLDRGTLHYDDCYYLARWYVNNIVKIKEILQNRFKYVFIDEAQDLEKYQLEIIESIFNTGESKCVIQRIGDINQSIYNSGRAIKVECDWQPRNPLHLSTSLRLTKEVAEVVDFFTLKKEFEHQNKDTHEFKVEGKNIVGEVIPPHLFVFNNNTIEKLKPKFEELIRQFNLFDVSKDGNTKRGYKIIGWSGTWKEEDSKGRLRLENIFPDEYRTAIESKTNRVKICDYLVHNPQIRTLKKYQDDIIDALCTLLHSIDCKAKVTRKGQDTERQYTSQILWKYLIDESRKTDGKLSEQDLLDFKSKLYSWSLSIATMNNIENTYKKIKSFVSDTFSNWLGFTVENEASAFLGTEYESIIPQDTNKDSNTSESIPIEICSVHSVKGQTHCATMYVETSYYTYETGKKQVINALKKENHSLSTLQNAKRSIETFKMIYVGFSRPTHLLCFAVLNGSLSDEQLSYFNSDDSGWSVVDLTEECSSPPI